MYSNEFETEHVGEDVDVQLLTRNRSRLRRDKLFGNRRSSASRYLLSSVKTNLVNEQAQNIKIMQYQAKLTEINETSQKATGKSKYKLLVGAMFLILIGTVVVVIVYLFSSGTSASETNAVSVRKICKTENTDECLQGLEQQLKDDSTAALRSPAHYLFTFAAFGFAVFSYSYRLNKKHNNKQNLLKGMPHDEVALGKSIRDRTMRSSVNALLSKVILLKTMYLLTVENFVAENKEVQQDQSWGYMDNSEVSGGTRKKEKVNFKWTTSVSFDYISELASREIRDLEIAPWETVRDYMCRLKKTCTREKPFSANPIDADKCDQYTKLYEEARFNEDAFGEAKFEEVKMIIDYFHRYFTLINTELQQRY